MQCVPCKLVNAGPDELRGTYLLDMVALFVFVFVFLFVFVFFLYLLDMVTISIHSLVLPSFDFHLNINVFKAKIQSWKRLNKFWCSGQHRANQRRLQRQLCLQVIYHWTNIIQTSSHYQSITSVTISTNVRREEDEEIFCFASGGFPVESCPAF